MPFLVDRTGVNVHDPHTASTQFRPQALRKRMCRCAGCRIGAKRRQIAVGVHRHNIHPGRCAVDTISTAAASDEGGFGAVTAALGPYGEELGAALGVSQHTAMLGVDPEKVGWVHRVVVSQL